jgi:hypothetical protein
MDITSVTFGIKDVVAIVTGVGSLVGIYFALKRSAEKAIEKNDEQDGKIQALKQEMEEKFLHAKNAKKANIMAIYEEINRNREEFKEKETLIYSRIDDIREEQKASHEKMGLKLDALATQMSNMSSNLAELTGYIRAKKEEK